MSDKKSNDTVIKSATILIVADIVVKILGVLFKIPLANLIGEVGMGYFQTAYDLYLPFYSIAISGLPIILSRLVSRAVSKENNRQVTVSVNCCRILFTVFGVIMTVAVLAAGLILCEQEAKWGIAVIAPSIFFSSVMGVGRGYFEGINNMVPTAVSQIFEALGKAVLGVIAAAILKASGFSLPIQAAGAAAGVLCGTVLGCFYLSVKIKRAKLQRYDYNGFFSFKHYFNGLLAIALPIVIGSLITQISGLVDVLTVQPRLEAMISADPSGIFEIYPRLSDGLGGDGFANVPAYLYGCFRGFATPIFALVPNLTAVIGVGLVPILTSAYERKDSEGLNGCLHIAFKIISIVVFPAALGYLALSGEILNLLYGSRPYGAEIAAYQLKILSVGAIFAGFSVPFTNILQSVGKERIPVYNMVIGVALKTFINIFTVGNTAVNVNGAAIGTVVLYLYIFVSDYFFIVKYTDFRLNIIEDVLKPLASAAISVGIGRATVKLLSSAVGQNLSTVIAIALAALIYFALLFFTKAVTKSDLLKWRTENERQ